MYGIFLASQAKPSQAKPNKTYYQMDTSSFAKGGVSRLKTPFLMKIPEKAFFVSTGFTGRITGDNADTEAVENRKTRGWEIVMIRSCEVPLKR